MTNRAWWVIQEFSNNIYVIRCCLYLKSIKGKIKRKIMNITNMRNRIVIHTYIEPYYAGMGPSKTRYSKKLRNT